MQTLNPYTTQLIKTYSLTDVEPLLASARPDRREEPMRRLGALLLEKKKQLAELIAQEMGKPIGEGIKEIEKCASLCQWYAEHATGLLAREPAGPGYVRYDPLGTILAIMPWNFPFWQVLRCAVPALMAGNSVILKHADNCTGCGIACEELFLEAGFAKGAFQTVLATHDTVADMIRDPRIAAVSLTGSTRAGEQVAQIAGSVTKKCVLELGGSDPFIVLEGADPLHAADEGFAGRMLNAGQSCISAKRFILHESLYEAFKERIVEKLRSVVMGDPLDPATTLGPLAREDLQENLDRQVQESIQAGAHCVAGGKKGGQGWQYEPTVLELIPEGCPARDEELFGPVFSLFKVSSTEEAIALANDTEFGLGASLFLPNAQEGEALAEQIESGTVTINGMTHSMLELPFGGIKRSGYGRELAAHGIKEFVNAKTVVKNRTLT